MAKIPIVVGISGASAPIYGIRTLRLLRQVEEVETHLVYSEAACRTIELETDYTISDVCRLAHVHYEPNDFAAAISSGSFKRSEEHTSELQSRENLVCRLLLEKKKKKRKKHT